MMTNDARYTHLATLIGGYFHQDFDLEFDSDEAAWQAYASTHSQAERHTLMGEIASFIDRHPEDLLRAFEAQFHPDVTIGASDEEIRAWLEAASVCIGG